MDARKLDLSNTYTITRDGEAFNCDCGSVLFREVIAPGRYICYCCEISYGAAGDPKYARGSSVKEMMTPPPGASPANVEARRMDQAEIDAVRERAALVEQSGTIVRGHMVGALIADIRTLLAEVERMRPVYDAAIDVVELAHDVDIAYLRPLKDACRKARESQ